MQSETVVDSKSAVKRGITVEPLEVARYVSSKYRREHREEALQVAYVVAADWRERYGHRTFDKPFSVACTAAFRRTKLALRRQATVLTISDGAIGGRTKEDTSNLFRTKSLTWTGGEGERSEERFAASADDAPEIGMRGERERVIRTAMLLKKLEPRGQKLVRAAMGPARNADLSALARRAKLPPLTARSILRQFVEAVGRDPVVSHIRIMLGEGSEGRRA